LALEQNSKIFKSTCAGMGCGPDCKLAPVCNTQRQCSLASSLLTYSAVYVLTVHVSFMTKQS